MCSLRLSVVVHGGASEEGAGSKQAGHVYPLAWSAMIVCRFFKATIEFRIDGVLSCRVCRVQYSSQETEQCMRRRWSASVLSERELRTGKKRISDQRGMSDRCRPPQVQVVQVTCRVWGPCHFALSSLAVRPTCGGRGSHCYTNRRRGAPLELGCLVRLGRRGERGVVSLTF